MSESAFFDTFNAKHKTDEEIATSFVPPANILRDLVSRDHTVLSGPRGSGKTTLLKMLTHSALSFWGGEQAEEFKDQVDFVSVFVAADRSWHGQLKKIAQQVPDQDAAKLLGMSAFTTHIFKATMSTFVDWNSLAEDADSRTRSLIPKIDAAGEKEICQHLADIWMLNPRAFTFLEMERGLGRRLADIGVLRNQLKFGSEAIRQSENRFLFVDYREGIKSATEIHNQVSNLADRRWSYIFDEMEVAPTFVQESLFADLRGEVSKLKINYKLALAPFNRNFRSILDGMGAAPNHDYKHIDLTFARKEGGYEFSRKLCEWMLADAGAQVPVEKLLGGSYFSFEDEDSDEFESSDSKYNDDRQLGKLYQRLSEKDASFREYLSRRNIDLGAVGELDEPTRAKTLRKVRNVAIIREYFSQPSKSDIRPDKLSSRSRKTYSLYTGSPSLLALTEGNPRSVINLFSPIVAEYIEKGGKANITNRRQADEVKRSIRIMRSLLKTVPHGDRRYHGKGILSFLDDIGTALYGGVMAGKFSDNPPLSFRVGKGVSSHHMEAIGKALNIGALVYVPDSDSEDVISSVIGKRFRLNYMLAVYYKLPLALDRAVTLENLLGRKLSGAQTQLDLKNEN